MAVVARASKTVRNKNILICLMCGVFLAMFAYDGFIGYPAGNDRLVTAMRDNFVRQNPPLINMEFIPQLEAWKGWNNEDAAGREKMTAIVESSKNRAKLEGWKGPLDIVVQRCIAIGLLIATIAAVWWVFHCQKRRAIAEETTVSPAEGVVLGWDKITRVDNTRWKKIGIVEITFSDEQGATRTAEFDDYKLEREPLLTILDQLADKAVNAEFIPKEEPTDASNGDVPAAS